MYPTDNGQGSRQRLLSSKDFGLPSQVHSVKSMLPHSHQLAALWIAIGFTYFSCSTVYFIVFYFIL